MFIYGAGKESPAAGGTSDSRRRRNRVVFVLTLDHWTSSVPSKAWIWRRLTTKCEAAGMKISTSESEAAVLSWKRRDCPVRVRREEERRPRGVL